ncbi:MAG: hypothetical protein ACRYFZ_09475 [Janthinobacterium lividum]
MSAQYASPITPDAQGSATAILPGSTAKLATLYDVATGLAVASLAVPAHPAAVSVALSAIFPAGPEVAELAETYNFPADSTYPDAGPTIQAELDKGPRQILWDRAVSMTPIMLSSGHELKAPAGPYGALARSGNNAPLIRNKHFTHNPALIQDKFISIIGGTWNDKNGQAANAQVDWLSLMEFCGTYGLLLDGGEGRNSPKFCFFFRNTVNFTSHNWHIVAIPGQLNTDGFHFDFYLNGVRIYNFWTTSTQDDGLPFNGNQDSLKRDGFDPNTTLYDGADQFGGMSNVLVDGWHADGECWWGQRMLICETPFENFDCRNYTGITHDYWLVMDAFGLPYTDRTTAYAKNLHWTNITRQCLDIPDQDRFSRRGHAIIMCCTDNVSITYDHRTDFTANWPRFWLGAYRHTTVSRDNCTYIDTDPNSAYTAPYQLLTDVYGEGTQYGKRYSCRNNVQQRAAPLNPNASGFLKFQQTLEEAPPHWEVIDLTGTTCQNIPYIFECARHVVTDRLIMTGTSLTGGIKPIWLHQEAQIGVLEFMGFTGTLADLVTGPGAANVGSLQTT